MSSKKQLYRSVFFGTPEFSIPSLESTVEHSHCLAVVTRPDRPRGRGQKLSPCEVKAWAIKKGIKTFSPASLKKESSERDEFVAFMKATPVDFLFVTAYGNLLPDEVLSWPKFGALNVHGSLLPRWRGAAPIQRSLEAGDVETGVCLQKMVRELDAGDVVESMGIPLGPQNSESLAKEMAPLGSILIKNFLQDFDGVKILGVPQDPKLVTFAPKIKKEEGFWRESWSALDCVRRTRAFYSWPGVKLKIDSGDIVKITDCDALSLPSVHCRPGELVIKEKRIFLGCSIRAGEPFNALWLKEIQPPNKSSMDAYAYFQNLLARTPRQESLKILEVSENDETKQGKI